MNTHENLAGRRGARLLVWAAGAAVLAFTAGGGSLAGAAVRPAAAPGPGATSPRCGGPGPNLVTDGSFETATVGDWQTGDSTDIPGWVVGPDVNGNPGSVDLTNDWTAQNGVLSLDLSGHSPGSVSQTITDVPGQAYELCFWLAGNVDSGPVIKHLRVLWDTTSSTGYTFNITGKTRTSMGWTRKRETVTGTGSDTLTFIGISPGAFGAAIDHVTLRVTTPVPR